MIRVKQGKAPRVLTDAEGAAAKERREAREHYTGSWSKSFKFDAYRHGDVKHRLNELFHYKCAYCESSYLATTSMDIEHFRPKLAVVTENNGTIKPGYYWLASEWSNLLPSCPDCNRKRTHDLRQEDVEPLISGKANLFPVKNDNRASLTPDAERNETRLLLHPAQDNVEALFKFKVAAKAVAMHPSRTRGINKERAEVSIEVLGLNRPELQLARNEVYLRFHAQLNSAKRALRRFTLDQSAINQDDLALELKDLVKFLNEDQLYASMCRYAFNLIRQQIEDQLKPLLPAHTGSSIDFVVGQAPVEDDVGPLG